MFLIACATETTNKVIETKNESNTSVVADSIVVDSVDTDTVAQMDVSIFTIEDYVALGDRSTLIEVFGEENLKNGISWYAEGTVKVSDTRITNPENANVLKVVWNTEDTNKIDFVEASYNVTDQDMAFVKTQIIKSKTGVYAGMPLKEVVEFNGGQAVEFAGFGWDYAGNHFEKKGSKLSETSIRFIMGYALDGYDDIPRNLFGDIPLSSENDTVMSAPIVIETMKLYANPE